MRFSPDDFALSVLRFAKPTRRRGSSLIVPCGCLLHVKLKIANHAVRMDYKYRRDLTLIIDELGKEYPPSTEGQSALEATLSPAEVCAAPIPPGQSCVKEVVFDVPTDAQISELRIYFGELGDIVEPIISGRKRIALTPSTLPASKE